MSLWNTIFRALMHDENNIDILLEKAKELLKNSDANLLQQILCRWKEQVVTAWENNTLRVVPEGKNRQNPNMEKSFA